MHRRGMAALITALVALGFAGWAVTRPIARTRAGRPEYLQVEVQRGAIRDTISGAGPLAAVNVVVVRANQQGTVVGVLAGNGQKVTAGDAVVILDNHDLTASLKSAQVNLMNNQTALNNLLNPLATSLRAQELKVAAARQTLSDRREDLANLTVTAPLSGIIASVKATQGSGIGSNALLFTIFDDQTPTLLVPVPQVDAGDVQPGQKAVVILPGYGTVEGRVVDNGDPATPAPTAKNPLRRGATETVSVALPPIAGVRAGMTGKAVFSLPDRKVTGFGSIEDDAVEVRAQVAGTVARIYTRDGDRVKAGQALLDLTNDNLPIQLDRAENDLKIQEQNYAYLLDPGKDPSNALRISRMRVEQSMVTVASKQDNVNDLQVRAPVSGELSSLAVNPGDRVTPGQPLFLVADYNSIQVTIPVDELDIAKVSVGQQALVAVDGAGGKRLAGKVVKINPEGIYRNEIATFGVTVAVDDPAGLMAGMNATVDVVTQEKTGLWLPAPVVKSSGGKDYVQVLVGGQPVQKEIRTGMRTPGQLEVVGGLDKGDQVIQGVLSPKPPKSVITLFRDWLRRSRKSSP